MAITTSQQQQQLPQVAEKSSSIPIPHDDTSRRTHHEIQLENDTRLYEWREGIMYNRIVNGMLQRSLRVGCHPKIRQSIRNVMQTQQQALRTRKEDYATSETSGSSSSSSSGSCGDEEWFLDDFYEEKERGYHYQTETAHRAPQQPPTLPMLPSAQAQGSVTPPLAPRDTFYHVRSCPTLHIRLVEEEYDDDVDDDDVGMFELDL